MTQSDSVIKKCHLLCKNPSVSDHFSLRTILCSIVRIEIHTSGLRDGRPPPSKARQSSVIVLWANMNFKQPQNIKVLLKNGLLLKYLLISTVVWLLCRQGVDLCYRTHINFWEVPEFIDLLSIRKGAVLELFWLMLRLRHGLGGYKI